jgi:hypothetical protein
MLPGLFCAGFRNSEQFKPSLRNFGVSAHDNNLILETKFSGLSLRIYMVGKVRRRTKPAGGPTSPVSSVGPFGPPTLDAVNDQSPEELLRLDGEASSTKQTEKQMRNLLFALAAVSTLGTAVAVSSPAAAREYPYCMQGKDAGYPGDCQYRSYAECQATASGRGEDCAINPRFAYSRQQDRSWR